MSLSKKPRLKVSFSGGETSGLMSRRIKNELGDKYELQFIFANTGQENEKTLQFVQRCDEEFGLDLVWVEAVVHPADGDGTTHRVVNFETASRNGEPYEEVTKKYGISNMVFQPCNRELKLQPMTSYMRSIGWEKYETAIGIRVDESRRVKREVAQKARIIYPLIDIWPTDKQEVNDFWEDQSFRLGLQEHEGNCKWCWKKSNPKHFRLIAERPEIYEFPRRMESLYGFHGAPYYGNPPESAKPRVFFRGNRSTDDLFALAAEVAANPIIPIRMMRSLDDRQGSFDFDAGCSESCELYPTEVMA